MRNRVLASLGFLALGGCALILEGTSQEVTFNSQPTGANVTVAGQSAVTPATLTIPKGTYDVVFEKSGYEEKTVRLGTKTSNWFYADFAVSGVAVGIDLLTGAWRAFESTELNPTLLPLPDTPEAITATLASLPPEAEVVIDGAIRGKTPLKLSLNWSPLEKEKGVTFRKAGYHDRKLILMRDMEQLKAELEPMPTRVRVAIRSVPPGAEAFLAGASVGHAPVFVDLDWLPGTPPKTLELALDGYHRARREIRREDQDLTMKLEEKVEEAALPLRIQPPDCLLEIDGAAPVKAGAQVKLAWSLSKKEHLLRFSHLGYDPKSVKLTQGEAQEALSVRLTPSLPGER
jgi:hypothetical protein